MVSYADIEILQHLLTETIRDKAERNTVINMKKILVVLTGGTIGSQVENEIINVSKSSPYRLISMYEELYGKEEFEIINPLNILSENVTPDSLLILLKALDSVRYEDYRGIIVTHGSDTLSYTSAFIGLLFHHVPVPVILVASNYPLLQEGSNGLDNFAKAVEFIQQKAVRGVFTIYRDESGISQVYLATRIMEADPFRDQFRDFSGQSYGRMEKGMFIRNTGKEQPAVEEVEANNKKEIEVPDSFFRDVMIVHPYPGMDYSRFCFNEETRPSAVLHILYHSATACLEGEKHSFLNFAERCREQSIKLYAASYKRIEGNRYATGDGLLKAGVIPMLNISPEAAYAKLLLLYNGKREVSSERVRQNIYFESVDGRNM